MKSYAGRRVLVTGGLGFIGSNLCLRLVQLGAHVTIMDSMEKGCGGNRRNIDPVSGKVSVILADIGDSGHSADLLGRIDTVFNLAGEVSHTHSMEFPERDLALNTRSHVNFLRECAGGARASGWCTPERDKSTVNRGPCP
jgi:UDP-glucose 4-epimerase